MKLKLLFIVFCCTVFSSKIFATHIVNGKLEAFILKVDSDSLTISLSLDLISTCEPNSIEPPQDLLVCAYDAITGLLIKSEKVKRYNTVKQSNCLGFCINQNSYTANIVMPKKSMYVFKSEICCRRSINNLRNDQSGMPFQGQTFYCRISGDPNDGRPAIDFPSYININPNSVDSIGYYINIPNTDSFVIAPVAPFTGASPSNNYPLCNSSLSFSTIQAMDYVSGFSPFVPLGTSGTSKIHTDRQKIELKCGGIGEYVTAYKLSFFRNGRLYYETVREIEVFVSNYVLTSRNQIDLTAKAFPTPVAEIKANICPLNVTIILIERSDFTNQNFISVAPFNFTKLVYDDYDVNFGKEYYYRLKVFKTNDTFYSDTVKVTFFNKSIHDVVLDDLKIAPNPSNQFFDISWQMANIEGIEVISSNGQTLLIHTTQQEKSYRLDASEFASGVYVVKFIDHNGKAYYKRMVKID